MVPLDGSELAECALNHVKNLAKEKSIGEVTLLNVVKVTPSVLAFYRDLTCHPALDKFSRYVFGHVLTPPI